MINFVIIKLIRIYQICISPMIGSHCRFNPTCSAYALECFKKFNFFKALSLTIIRLGKCHPFCKGGYDPVLKKGQL